MSTRLDLDRVERAERASRVAVWVTAVVLVVAWFLLPRVLFWWLVGVVAIASAVSLVAAFMYWRDKAAEFWGEMVYAHAAANHLQTQKRRLDQEITRLRHDNRELTLAFSRQNVRLGELAEEHSKCPPQGEGTTAPVRFIHGMTDAAKNVSQAGRLRALPAPRKPGTGS